MNSPTRTLRSPAFVALPVLVALLLTSTGCGKKEASGTGPSAFAKSAIVSTEKTSFNEVTAHLDPGGSIYGYLSTSQWLNGLSGRLGDWREAVLSIPGLDGEDRSNVAKAFDLVTRLIKNSGVEGITGIGVSGIAIEKGLYQTKFMVHRDPSSSAGGIWTFFGKAPRPLVELDWLPADTVWAGSSDIDIAGAWSALVNEAGQSGFPEAKAGLDQLNGVVRQATAMSLDQILGSLGGQMGAFLTLSQTRKNMIPLPTGSPLEMPEPGLVIFLKVKDDTVFNWIDGVLKSNPQVVRSEEGGARIRTLPLPLPLPIPLRPTLARLGDHLFVASNEEVFKNLLAVKSGKQPGLKSTEEFKKLAQGMSLEGNSFAFVGGRLGGTIQQIQMAVWGQAAKGSDDAPVALLRKLNSFGGAATSFAVSRSSAEGWFTVGRGNQEPANAIILPLAVAPVAILAGIALPALAKARGQAQDIACINNLKQLGLGARIYATDHKDVSPKDFLSMKNELTTPRVLFCPQDPNGAAHTSMTWETFDASKISYEFVSPGLAEATAGFERKVLFRCRIHGHECMGDGSVVRKNAAR